jgi:MarR family transcriptional regulator, organic hydroperoxide resistance regulator
MEPATLLLKSQLCFAIYAANNAYGRAYKSLLDPLGLTYPQYLVMLCLWDKDGQKVGEIGSRVFLETNTLTPLLKRLEAAGLVRRRRDSKDERQVSVSLTAAGMALREKATSVPQEIATATGLEAGQSASLKDWLEWLREALDASLRKKTEKV